MSIEGTTVEITNVSDGEPRQWGENSQYGPFLSYRVEIDGEQWVEVSRKPESPEPQIGDKYGPKQDGTGPSLRQPASNAPDGAIPSLTGGAYHAQGGSSNGSQSAPKPRSQAPKNQAQRDAYWENKDRKDDLNVIGMRRAHSQEMAIQYFAALGKGVPDITVAAEGEALRQTIEWFEYDTEQAVKRGPLMIVKSGQAKARASEATNPETGEGFETAPPQDEMPF